MHFYNFSTAKQQSNCDHTIVTKKDSSTGKNGLEVSPGTIVAISIGCIALVVIMPIAVVILVKRKRRKSKEPPIRPIRPPAPLPDPQPHQPNLEIIYCEPEPEPSRRGSVDTLELHSNDRRPNIPLRERQQSSGPGRVIPRPPSPSDAMNTREGSLGDTQPLPLSKEIKTSLTCMSSYESLPRSAPEDAIPERVEQLTVENTTNATESSQQHSTERKMNFDDSKFESAEISALSQDQDIESASGYASANHLPYSNLPPQPPPRPQVTAESDACMKPCELPSESVDIDELSSSESDPYLECFP
ncbi:PREDICTED: uncharacterized protein LOC107342502 isoform X2 [Acropora digitifera]|uniref:uncharacterized protein LOC107342502 isoform X2 n=1 Tax=Acropora digitifera TaxID=70779 RepID=UPI00077A6AD9|nr:PREDICTED: uncharacterized protein LOC107342502 isoform X2 [Acropora digitifera]